MAASVPENLSHWRPIAGLRLAAGAAGIRYQGRDDLVVLELAEGSHCAGVFTRNAFCAAPVVLARHHLATCSPRYLLINAGNANAGTGKAGMAAAEGCCTLLAGLGDCAPEAVLPFSTGVIGEPLALTPFESALPRLLPTLDAAGWPAAARAIMTTDTVPKLATRQLELAGRTITVTGMAKGSGMICPDMATMLAFIASDAAIAPELLQGCLEAAVADSFNAITVDGDTSTNDACMLIATGAAGQAPITDKSGADYAAFSEAVAAICLDLATAIARDGEGATKLVTIRAEQARDRAEARQVAYTIAHSPLVKTALFAADPNWGRILAAVGRAGLANLDVTRIRIELGKTLIVADGGRADGYTEAAGAAELAGPEVTIRVLLGRGNAAAQVLTCDLSYDYVRINADYRS